MPSRLVRPTAPTHLRERGILGARDNLSARGCAKGVVAMSRVGRARAQDDDDVPLTRTHSVAYPAARPAASVLWLCFMCMHECAHMCACVSAPVCLREVMAHRADEVAERAAGGAAPASVGSTPLMESGPWSSSVGSRGGRPEVRWSGGRGLPSQRRRPESRGPRQWRPPPAAVECSARPDADSRGQHPIHAISKDDVRIKVLRAPRAVRAGDQPIRCGQLTRRRAAHALRAASAVHAAMRAGSP